MNGPGQTDGLVVVHVRDQVNRTLAGHGGREYTSPAHHRSDALILVALLLGRPAQPNGDGGEPVALAFGERAERGGQVDLSLADRADVQGA